MNHTAHRTDSRRARREQRQTVRQTRHERLRALLARVDQGVLTSEDCAVLRGDVEAEITENETHRRSAGGQQAASMRLHRTLAAADTCLIETETDRDLYAARLARVEQHLDTLSARLPESERHLVEALRQACADDDQVDAARDVVETGRR
ncbi:hypothetical protein ACFWZT_00735 [Streptomyces alboflavus]|uniref:hypothetical protein n=1 Tax=Streptomyces alboflavus TaxID=67267 RepID=UPI0036A88830